MAGVRITQYRPYGAMSGRRYGSFAGKAEAAPVTSADLWWRARQNLSDWSARQNLADWKAKPNVADWSTQ